MSYARTTGSRRFREAVVQAYPGLEKNPAYWHMFVYLLSPSMLDDKTDRPVIPAKMLAHFEGREKAYKNNHHKAHVFLKAFKQDVLPGIEYGDYSYSEGKARTVLKPGLDTSEADSFINMMLDDEAKGNSKEVILASGKAYSDPLVREQHKRWLRSVLEPAPDIHTTKFGDRIIAYHNALQRKRFSHPVEKNYSKVLDFLRYAKVTGTDKERSKAAYALERLPAILENPKPILVPSKRTARPTCPHASLMSIWSTGARQAPTATRFLPPSFAW